MKMELINVDDLKEAIKDQRYSVLDKWELEDIIDDLSFDGDEYVQERCNEMASGRYRY